MLQSLESLSEYQKLRCVLGSIFHVAAVIRGGDPAHTAREYAEQSMSHADACLDEWGIVDPDTVA